MDVLVLIFIFCLVSFVSEEYTDYFLADPFAFLSLGD